MAHLNHAGVGCCVAAADAHVDTTRSDRPVWLLKCPPVLARSLQSSDSSRPFAKLVVSIDPLATSDDTDSAKELVFNHDQFAMVLGGTEMGNVPESYYMEMSKDFVPMCVFSESTQGTISAEGRVKSKLDVRPRTEDFDSYGKLCRERTKKHMVKSRQMQVMDNDYGTNMRPLPGMVGMLNVGYSDKKKIQGKGSDTKRTRRDRGEMEEVLFKLFERQPNWTLKILIQETKQPEQFVKDLLKDLCIYNNKGASQGSYELKPEYKRSAEDPTDYKP